MVLDPQITILKEINFREATIWLRSDDIVHVHYKKNATLDIELQADMRKVFKQITEHIPHGFIFSAEEGFNLTKEAREHMKANRDPVIKAYAIIADNLAYRIIANFVLKVNKPSVPYKLFANVEDGVRWLKTL